MRQWLHGLPVYTEAPVFWGIFNALPSQRLVLVDEEQFLSIVDAQEYFVSLLLVTVCEIILRLCHEEQCQGVSSVDTCSESTGRSVKFHIFSVFSAMVTAIVDKGFTSSVEDFVDFLTFST